MTRVIAVIHHRDYDTSAINFERALSAGADGVCFIDMTGHVNTIDAISSYAKTSVASPNFLVGANRFALRPDRAVKLDAELGLDFTWADNPGISSKSIDWELVGSISDELSKLPVGYRFFGSVAFKTQALDDAPGRAALLAQDVGWIPTTSGPATGVAPTLEKLRGMKDGTGVRELAVASGVDPDNVTDIAPLVDWIFVATGVSSSFHELDVAKLQRVVDVAHSVGAE